MKVVAELYDVRTSEVVIDESDWEDETDAGDIVSCWLEGNLSCDCNRGTFFGLNDCPCEEEENRFRLTRLTIDGEEVEDIEA